MKNSLSTIFYLFALLMVFSSCEKNENAPSSKVSQQELTFTYKDKVYKALEIDGKVTSSEGKDQELQQILDLPSLATLHISDAKMVLFDTKAEMDQYVVLNYKSENSNVSSNKRIDGSGTIRLFEHRGYSGLIFEPMYASLTIPPSSVCTGCIGVPNFSYYNFNDRAGSIWVQNSFHNAMYVVLYQRYDYRYNKDAFGGDWGRTHGFPINAYSTQQFTDLSRRCCNDLNDQVSSISWNWL